MIGLVWASGALASACKGGSKAGDSGSGVDVGDGGALADASDDGGAARARRPPRRFYMARTDKRCEVYSVEGDVISTPTPALCTEAIEAGERIRLTGRSCMREGAPEREQPVSCPMELAFADMEYREGLEREAREQAARDQAADAGDGGLDGGGLDGGGRDSGKRAGGR